MKRRLRVWAILLTIAPSLFAQDHFLVNGPADNWHAGVNVGFHSKLTNNTIFTNLNPHLTVRVGKDFSPLLGAMVDVTSFFNDRRFPAEIGFPSTYSHTVVKAIDFDLLGRLSISNLLEGYPGYQRSFEAYLIAGIGLNHVCGINTKPTNDLTAKVGLDISVNLDPFVSAQGFELYVEPALKYNLTRYESGVHFNPYYAAWQLAVGVNYHFGRSHSHRPSDEPYRHHAIDPIRPARPVVTEPVRQEKPVTKPVVTEPARQEKPVAKPVVTEPVRQEKPVAKPVVAEPARQEKPVTKPVVTEPVRQEQPVTKPVVTEPVRQEKPVTKPVVTEPVRQEKIIVKTITEPARQEKKVTETDDQTEVIVRKVHKKKPIMSEPEDDFDDVAPVQPTTPLPTKKATTTAKATTTTSKATTTPADSKHLPVIRFDAWDNSIPNDQNKAISEVANYMKNHPRTKLVLKGSDKHTAAVKNALTKHYGISASRLSTAAGTQTDAVTFAEK